MKLYVVLCSCLFVQFVVTVDITLGAKNLRSSRKLFGGYRITPRFCKPTRQGVAAGGPNICMFNHECLQRNGEVVGACMDGFLFGACCQLSSDAAGELIENEINAVTAVSNSLAKETYPPIDIMSSGVSQIAQSLLNQGDNVLLQLDGEVPQFTATGVTHSTQPETLLLNGISNTIHANDFKVSSTKAPIMEDRKTTVWVEDTTVPYSQTPTIHISISKKPGTIQRPGFRPKPTKPSDADKYVLVPTLSHNTTKNEPESVINILQLLNGTTPAMSRTTTTGTTRKPPSTSYVFSTTLKPRRTTPLTTTTKRKTKPPTKKKVPISTPRPTAFSTFAYSPTAFPNQKPSSYGYGTTPTRRPTVVNTHIAGPGFSVTSSPFPNPAPTLIVLGPTPDSFTPESEDEYAPIRPGYSSTSSSYPYRPTAKPINSVTINNHVTQNIYSTSERPHPQPTVLITPKPALSSYPPIDFNSQAVEVEGTPDQLINFPPVRNPNLNMSNPGLDDELTTPTFIADDAMNTKVENFVNKIIQGLQEPFEGLKDVVVNATVTTTKKPVKKTGTTTKKPATTRKPTIVRRTTVVTTTKRPKTTRRPVTTTTEEVVVEEDTVVNSDSYRDQCGIRPLLKTGRIVGGKGATFGKFPWQVLVRESTWLGLFTKNKCGGVLISTKYVMTAAHCQPGFLASLVAVFGEFDISGDLESRRPLSRNIRRVIVHRKYDPATFENDLALLELESPVKFDAHILPICLPRDGEDFTGRMATVTGWGRLKYGGGVPSVLQEVQVPIMENHVCQEMFRTAGHSKIILESFLCAGYANGQKDSCEGDSGGPLVLQRPDGRYQLAGTVSHGIKCAAPYLPGVYMRTAFFKPWITAITGVE